MKIYQVINDSIVDAVFQTRESAAMRLLEIVENTKNSILSNLLRVDVLEVK